MNHAEVFPEVCCKHGHLPLSCHCHLRRIAPNKHEGQTSRRRSNNNSSAQLKKHPDPSPVFCHKAKHMPDTTTHRPIFYRGNGSYQLQRYLKEPAGCGAALFIEAAPAPRCIDLVDRSKRNGKKERKRRTMTLEKKIKALEEKISGFCGGDEEVKEVEE
ncbi:hypothetical protein N431DRAFT_470990 [Stipitochalara longipes BDJ]|nr:hypothetical protein N431DRAFT_470990 [Stipitochalara longipes BDJ]